MDVVGPVVAVVFQVADICSVVGSIAVAVGLEDLNVLGDLNRDLDLNTKVVVVVG